MALQTLIEALTAVSFFGKGPRHVFAVISFNDAFDRKTAETVMFSAVILLVIFLFAYFTKKQLPDKTN